MGSPWRPRGPDDLDEEQRARIRRQVLGGVRPLRRSFADRVEDRAYDVFTVLAVPAPHIVRTLIAVAVILSIVGSATVASADSLPAEPLYAVKLASEQVRLTLARTPEDRASIQLSMAEHRLAEAVRLIQEGRDAEAVEVTSAYGSHLATAAAELATVERLNVAARPVVEHLRKRLAEQQLQATEMAARFVEDPATPVGAQLLRTIASFAPPLPSGSTVSEGIAEHAANVADQLAAVAERLAQAAAGQDGEEEEEGAAAAQPAPQPAAAAPAAPAAAPRQEPPRAPAAAPARATATPTARTAAAAQRTDAPVRATTAVGNTGPDAAARATATPRPTATPRATPKTTPRATVDPKRAEAARVAAEKAKHEAEKARIAADKAKEAAKKTATPRPTPKR